MCREFFLRIFSLSCSLFTKIRKKEITKTSNKIFYDGNYKIVVPVFIDHGGISTNR